MNMQKYRLELDFNINNLISNLIKLVFDLIENFDKKDRIFYSRNFQI